MWHFKDGCGWPSMTSIPGHNYHFVSVVVSSAGLHVSFVEPLHLYRQTNCCFLSVNFSAVNGWSSSDISCSVHFRFGSSRSLSIGLFIAQPAFWWTLLMVCFFFFFDRSSGVGGVLFTQSGMKSSTNCGKPTESCMSPSKCFLTLESMLCYIICCLSDTDLDGMALLVH